MKRILHRRPLLVAVTVIVAVAAGVGIKLTSNATPTGAATVQLVVDSPQSAIADLKQDPLPLISRAQVFAQLMSSSAVLDAIAKAAGVPQSDLTAEGPYSGAGQPLDVPTPSEARGAQLIATNTPYHFTFVPDANIPLITASVQGPTPALAGKLANAVYPGIKAWLSTLQSSGDVPVSARVTLRQFGHAQAGTVNAGSSTTFAGIAVVAVLLIGFIGLFAVEARRRARERDEMVGLGGPRMRGRLGLPAGRARRTNQRGATAASDLLTHADAGASHPNEDGDGHLDRPEDSLVLPYGAADYDPAGVTAGWSDDDAAGGESAAGFDHSDQSIPTGQGFSDDESDGSNPPRRWFTRVLNR
jgi:hypothetical protein